MSITLDAPNISVKFVKLGDEMAILYPNFTVVDQNTIIISPK